MSNQYWNLPSSSSQHPHHHEYSPMEIDGEEEEDSHNREDERVGSGQCIICTEQWGSEGDHHQLCCLPCGHLYGYSCISTWIQQPGAFPVCPVCKAPCTLNGLTRIYGYGLPGKDLQQRYQNLEVEHENLKREKDSLLEENRRLKQHQYYRSIVS
ncbi:hypothetical protein ACOSQ2_033256 [Xanthoceras sorbifolium]